MSKSNNGKNLGKIGNEKLRKPEVITNTTNEQELQQGKNNEEQSSNVTIEEVEKLIKELKSGKGLGHAKLQQR